MSKVELLLLTKTSSTATAAISSASINAGAAVIQAKKVTGANTGNVYVGTSGIVTASAQEIELQPGDSYALPIPAGDWMDLSQVFIACATSGDGVIVHFSPRAGSN